MAHPAAIWRAHGVLWVSFPIEKAIQPPHRRSFSRMIRELVPQGFTFEADAPGFETYGMVVIELAGGEPQ